MAYIYSQINFLESVKYKIERNPQELVDCCKKLHIALNSITAVGKLGNQEIQTKTQRLVE